MQHGDSSDDAETKQKQQTCEALEILQVKIGVKQGTEHTRIHTIIHTHTYTNTLTQHYRSAQEKQNQEF